MRNVLVLVLLLGLVACTDRERIDRVASPAPDTQTVLVGTARMFDPANAAPGTGRADTLSFGRYDVAVPPEHRAGRIRRPYLNQEFDPQRHYAVSETVMMDRAGFRAELARQLQLRPTTQREAVLFVHGFNTSFIEGVYRVAQLGHDLNLSAVMLHFSWPSLGAPLAYAHDRDSALYSRDGLEAMIRESAASGSQRLLLVAHSMGSQLLMETLRQIALRGDRALLNRIGGVILISPDVDVDVFRMQAQAIGVLPQPFLIVTSQRDRILQLSAQLTGQPQRLGNLADPARLDGLEVTLLDVSAFSTGVGHFDVAQSPALIQLLDQVGAIDTALGTEQSGRLPLIPATILTLQNTTQIVLEPLTDTRANPLRRLLAPETP